MTRIFLGLILIFFELHFTINGHKLGLLPDFAGYLLIISGISQMKSENDIFSHAVKPAVFLVFWTGADYLLDLLNLQISERFHIPTVVSMLIYAVTTLLFLFITFTIISGLREIELRGCAIQNPAPASVNNGESYENAKPGTEPENYTDISIDGRAVSSLQETGLKDPVGLNDDDLSGTDPEDPIPHLKNSRLDLGVSNLQKVWNVLAAFSLVYCIASLQKSAGAVIAIAVFICRMVFLVRLYRTRTAYEHLRSSDAEAGTSDNLT